MSCAAEKKDRLVAPRRSNESVFHSPNSDPKCKGFLPLHLKIAFLPARTVGKDRARRGCRR